MKESKFVSEVEYLTFKNGLRNILISMAIGFVIGFVIINIISPGISSGAIAVGIACAGMPYAWNAIPIGFYGWVGLLIKVAISLFLGWIITPIALIYNLIQMKRYEAHVREADERERMDSV